MKKGYVGRGEDKISLPYPFFFMKWRRKGKEFRNLSTASRKQLVTAHQENIHERCYGIFAGGWSFLTFTTNTNTSFGRLDGWKWGRGKEAYNRSWHQKRGRRVMKAVIPLLPSHAIIKKSYRRGKRRISWPPFPHLLQLIRKKRKR